MAATTGDDVLDGTTKADTINALAGNDTIDAKTRPTAPGSGIDVVDGGAGDDTLVVNCSAETQSVQLGSGGSPDFTVRSTSGNFYVDAYSIEKIKFTGGSGNDTIDTGQRPGTVNGGGGIDHWIANLSGLFTGITFALGTTTSIAAAGLTSILGIERLTITTGFGDDKITGGAHADNINTGDGDDTIDAGTRQPSNAAIDVVDGGADFDTLIVNASAETQSVQLGVGLSPSFTVRSTSGNFYLDAYNMERILFTGGSGNDTINTGDRTGTIDGGGGVDHWLADLGYVASNIVFAVDTTKSIAAAGLTSILGIDRLTLTTGSGNDTITGNGQADTVNTGAGDDKVSLRTRPTAPGSGIDVMDGGAGTDTLVVGASSETQSVTLGVGNSPSFSVRSTSGKYYIDAYNTEIINIYTGSGNDTINTGNRGGIVDGNGGIDHWLADLSAVTSNIVYALDTTTAIAAAGLTSLLDLERITLTTGSGNDVITGNSQADTISTGAGNDKISARSRPASSADIDVVDGGSGTDTLVVGASSETQSVTLSVGNSPTFAVRSTSGKYYIDAYNMELITILTGSANDTINTGDHGGSLDGNGGIDHWLADLSAVTSNIVFNLGTTTAIAAAGLTSILDIERISLTTGAGSDTITGGAEADTINTSAGNDTIDARTRPTSSASIDVVDGGAGTDTLVVDASADTKGIQIGVGTSPSISVRSNSGSFYIDAYSVEKLVFTGGSGGDNISGRSLADTIKTNGGVDILFGGDGNDTLDGGSSGDTLTGGRGADKMTGGTGIDLFDYNSVADSLVVNGQMDTITDFVSGTDDVSLVDIDANGLVHDNDQAFIFIGGQGFHNVRGELRSVAGLFEADINGDGAADFRVFLSNGATVAQSDFFL